MILKLSDEQRQALAENPDGPVAVQDQQTRKVYVLVDRERYERELQFAREFEDVAAVQAGVEDVLAGRVVPFEEVDARIRRKLGLPVRS